MTISNLYIDSVFIETDDGERYSGITNLLDGEDVHPSQVDTTKGYKYIIQLVNGSNSTINMASTHIRVQWCINYKNDEGEAVSQLDHNIDITSGTIASGASYYIGHTISSVGMPTINTTDNNYIPHDTHDGELVSAARIRLFLDGVAIDIIGENSKEEGEHFFVGSLIDFIHSGANTSDDAICRRKSSVDAPTGNTFTDSHWNFSTSGFASYLSGSAHGDPHITTLTGDHYEFDYLGAFRLFEDTIQGNKIIINGLSEKGPGRWSKKQYIQKLYIQHNQKYILVDMGFRGSPVKVLENNQMDYTEEELPFNSEAKRYSFNSTYRTQDQDEPITEDLPALIRNQFSLLINSEKTLVNIMHITLQNVNQYNLQPCRFSFNSTKITDKAKGCLVDRKYAPVSKLLTIKDTHEIPEPSKEDLENIPELEINPKLRNIQWQ